jgi:hypothetical protein
VARKSLQKSKRFADGFPCMFGGQQILPGQKIEQSLQIVCCAGR